MNNLKNLFVFMVLLNTSVLFSGEKTNNWLKIGDDDVGQRASGALIWSEKQDRFILIGGMVSHFYKKPRPYDIQSWDAVNKQWQNDLPEMGQAWGGISGPVNAPGFKDSKFKMIDVDGNIRPNYQSFQLHFQYTYAPWNNKFYAFICGYTIEYDPIKKTWRDLNPENSPAPKTDNSKSGLSWSSLCADSVNQEILLFGGSSDDEREGPGTWIYSPDKNNWSKPKLEIEPPLRALSQMVFDEKNKKIILFGGDRLSYLRSDTWVYDCLTKKWEEKKPILSPAPRFGHNMVYLPKSQCVILMGGKTYSSNTSYLANLYKELPFEIWKYDFTQNMWSLLDQSIAGDQNGATGYPPQHYVYNNAAVSNNDDEILYVAMYPNRPQDGRHETWRIHVDPSLINEKGTKEKGVPFGTITTRTESFDPNWYLEGVPEADLNKSKEFYKSVVANQFVEVNAPKWLMNRQSGGWSTVAFDYETDQIIHMGGGHSSYSGNDIAHFDVNAQRWSINKIPEFCLEYNGKIGVNQGNFSFDGDPWTGNHNYKSYMYSGYLKKIVKIASGGIIFYDTSKRKWERQNFIPIDSFFTKGNVVNLCDTPNGVYIWAKMSEWGSEDIISHLDRNGKVSILEIKGEKIPLMVGDGSTMTYDESNNRILFTASFVKKRQDAYGQVWSLNCETKEMSLLNPIGMEKIKPKRFAREAVIIPSQKLMMLGYNLEIEGSLQTLFYDIEENSWLVAEIPGADVISRGAPGMQTQMGLTYDKNRDLVWLVLSKLHPGSMQILKINKETLHLKPL